jgi:DNA (cytosine-5)-methyltransferase 1
MRLADAVRPEIISMENVPELSDRQQYPVFHDFVTHLTKLGYFVSYMHVDASRYGVPQGRRRLVVLASRLGPIALPVPTHLEDTVVTVRHALSVIEKLKAGQSSKIDPIHRASALSPMNLKRLKATPRNGGSAKSWPKKLLPKCYRRKSGQSYLCSVYGRMSWDKPSPTITTNCMTLGAGRFGHPSQNRAISLREAAILQSFPKDYDFLCGAPIKVHQVAKQIGNAVPVLLGRAIGQGTVEHLQRHALATGAR